MLWRCLKAEAQKCRRAPVWLAFLVLPLFPAILGTGNYLANLAALENGWYSLWSQHTLFSSLFFLPALLGVFCAWQWRLEHSGHNWNSFLTAPVPVGTLYAAKLILAAGMSLLAQGIIGGLFLLSGKLVGLSGPPPAELPGWLLGGLWGAASAQPGDPGLCPAGGPWPGGRHPGAAAHCPGGGLCLPLFPALSGDAGQQPPDGPVPAVVCVRRAALDRPLCRPHPASPPAAGRRDGVSPLSNDCTPGTMDPERG